MKKHAASLVLFCGLFSGSLALADCTAVVNDAYAWATKQLGHSRNHIDFLVSSMKAPTRFVHYSQGVLSLSAEGELSSGQTPGFFSDRAWCPNNSGPFCSPYQKFDYRKMDLMTFTLQRNGVLKVVFHSKGGVAYNVNMQCANGFLYGSLIEPSGASFITMNLTRVSAEPTH